MATSRKSKLVKKLDMSSDAGHEEGKFVRGGGGMKHFPSDLVSLSMDEWTEATNSTFNNPDYVLVNNQPYVMGATAREYGQGKRARMSRYTREWMGALTAIGQAWLINPDDYYDDEGREVEIETTVSAAFPYKDFRHTPALIESILGHWEVKWGKEVRAFTVTSVIPFAEPLGGLANLALQEDDEGYYFDRRIYDDDVLVIDIGGRTVHIVAIGRGLKILHKRSETEEIGALEILDSFKTAVIGAYPNDFATGHVNPRKLRDALRTGIWQSGVDIDMSDLATAAKGKMLDTIKETIRLRAGGLSNYSYIILTGGGVTLMGDLLVAELQKQGKAEIFFAHEDRDLCYLANALGGEKISIFTSQEQAKAAALAGKRK
jgi:hypothetical protein